MYLRSAIVLAIVLSEGTSIAFSADRVDCHDTAEPISKNVVSLVNEVSTIQGEESRGIPEINLNIPSYANEYYLDDHAVPPGEEWKSVPSQQDPKDYLGSSKEKYFYSPVAFKEDPIVQKIAAAIRRKTNDPQLITALVNRYVSEHFIYGNPDPEEEKRCLASVPAGLAYDKNRLCKWGSSWRTLRSSDGSHPYIKGDCIGAAYLTAALLRASGVPTIIAYTPARYYMKSFVWSLVGGGYGQVSHYYNYAYINGKWYFLEPQKTELILNRYPTQAADIYKNSKFETDTSDE